MSKFSASYRVDGRTFSLQLHASGWEEAEFHLDALKVNGDFVEKDQIEYNLAGTYHRAKCRFFETEEEARRHLSFLRYNAEVDGEIVFSTRVPSFMVPKK